MSKLDEIFEAFSQGDEIGTVTVSWTNKDIVSDSKAKVKALFLELVAVPPCEENCTDERHAYHRGAYDFAQGLQEKINKL